MKSAVLVVLLLVPGAAAGFEPCVGLLVNTTDDVDDGLCDAAHCSLREAILAADTPVQPGVICFDISGTGPHVIAPLTALPVIHFPMLIDGYSEPDAVVGTSPAPGPIDAAPSVVLAGPGGPPYAVDHGLRVEGPGVTVRGLVIGGFNRGIFIRNTGGTTVEGCFIGTDASGLATVPNNNGFEISGSGNVRIGGTDPSRRNLISGNRGLGISAVAADGLVVEGSLIGVDATGATALPNLARGVILSSSDDARIGGGAPGAGNVIGSNRFDQLFITGGTGASASRRTIVQGNYVGTDQSGTVNLGGGGWGVLWFHSVDALIGGTAPGEGNVIAFNSIGVGTALNSGATDSGNAVLGNRIWANANGAGNGLGIDLKGEGLVTPNDHCDPDTGTNRLQNFPELTGVMDHGGSLTVDGELDSEPITDPNVTDPRYLIEVFAGSACDSSGHGEGEIFLGRELIPPPDVTTCLSPFSIFLPVAVPAGWSITATATSPYGDTSEFSACLPVPPAGSGAVPDGVSVPGTPLTISRDPGGDLTLSWGSSCSASDSDYEIYEGTLGIFYGHAPVVCTTGGATTATFTPSAGNRYYLVIPTDGNVEGSHGVDSALVERPAPGGGCRTQILAPTCP